MATDFYELLNAIRLRPAMYISPISVTALYNFLGGYTMAVGLPEISEQTTPSYREFNNWVAMKLGFFESTSGWRNMLLKAENEDEEKAFDRFFVLLDEFKQRQATIIMWAKVPPFETGEPRKTKFVQIIKYTDDGGLFFRWVDDKGEVLDENYCQTLDFAFLWIESQVGKLEWQQRET